MSRAFLSCFFIASTLLCVFSISVPHRAERRKRFAFGSSLYAPNRALTARLSRSWGMAMLSPFFNLWNNPDSFVGSYLTQPTNQELPHIPTGHHSVPYYGDEIVSQEFPEEKTFLPQSINLPAFTNSLNQPVSVEQHLDILDEAPHFAELEEEHDADVSPLPLEGAVIHDRCDPKIYEYPLECPTDDGFFRVGDSCYYLDNTAKLTAGEAKYMCQQLNDKTGQTLGDWALLAINDEFELEALGPAVSIMTEELGVAGPLWVEQIMLVQSIAEAQIIGSPYLFATNCTGSASVLNTGHLDDVQWIRETLAEPAACNILTWLPEHDESEEAEPCIDTRLNFVCELALDGDPGSFKPHLEGMVSRSSPDVRLQKWTETKNYGLKRQLNFKQFGKM